MAKEGEERKKEKKEKKERKERKRREAEELAVREKKISKKHKSKSKEEEKPEKSKKKSKKYEEVEEEEKSPSPSPSPKKSKESKKKHKRSSDESEEIVDSKPVTVPIVTIESDSDFEFDKEDIKNLLESYSKEELINLIYKTAEKGSKLISAVFESADRDSSQRNIFVRGLGWDTTHENLKAAFEVYGEITECSVVMDKDTGRAKGFGFVLFKTRKGARAALKNPEKRMYNRTVSCLPARPFNSGKPREQQQPVESVKIDLSHTGNQSEMALPGIDLGHGLDKGHQQQQNMSMYAGQNMPFYGHSQPPPGFNPMYGAMMGNPMVAGLQNYRMFGSGMMNQGPMMPPNHMGMVGQYVGDGNVNGVGAGAGAGAGFDGERAWYLR
ncbi:unnamed protein product [Arabidopsis thaliana]|jgi:hypothetical protein|uniref:UBP1-associated proteins 1B n=3 Tax=Arabidopsis TaxID=3701 RepID=UBA1B_ARATH|nr:RNA-binding (RRM/RBD/RNP motifs) family protein [Arabidopsis thaliana]Q9SHZ5.2 RecName: Full=UBP1-associated proteins 1B [Arabidopsis thaliana]KAG7641642.1 RNA recognition motif domain [Arabidopsis suecica]AAD25814.2 putative RNA-binding protein [Arabidopsis thaliana]AEC07264.1 RNA-binding (RRM/RBD/RNP motifs) family protein [Arabidopsis thaliana]CAA0369221.1 unnamed protein product [Arabidopsis thaliana]VYS53130.1 unnamed protein product [Arabidopsis thaliana]|eukprot:NP_565526.1 RNA-binding (RRM/RBD/RNP motifs) family protein [Arabidopsis thaliana]